MKIQQSGYTIVELSEMYKRKDIIINKEYQRGTGIWPDSAKSYFIDTILEGFPFPKIYLYQAYDKSYKPIREVIDGQQRLTTIFDFLENKLKLTSASVKYSGYFFNDLEAEKQRAFREFTVQFDVILAADRSEILEMFRRINSYTAPLNEAEKRHSEFQGDFKWFINDLSDKFSPNLDSMSVFTPKQILRMHDAEFFTDLALVLDEGLINKSSASFRRIYTKYDKVFNRRKTYFDRVSEFMNLLATDLKDIHGTMIMKSYVLHSLFTAIVHIKYGIPNGSEALEIKPTGQFFRDKKKIINGLLRLANAHEEQDEQGNYKEYVKACLSTTTKVAQRKIRTKAIIKYLV